MEQVSIISKNSTLTKLRMYPHNSWSSIKVKPFSTIGTSVLVSAVIALSVVLYYKGF